MYGVGLNSGVFVLLVLFVVGFSWAYVGGGAGGGGGGGPGPSGGGGSVASCVDSDGGLVYSRRGIVTVENGSGTFLYEDHCEYGEGEVNTTVLREYACFPLREGAEVEVTCNSGCLDGACIADNVDIPEVRKMWYEPEVVFPGTPVTFHAEVCGGGGYSVEVYWCKDVGYGDSCRTVAMTEGDRVGGCSRYDSVYAQEMDVSAEVMIGIGVQYSAREYARVNSNYAGLIIEETGTIPVLPGRCMDTDGGSYSPANIAGHVSNNWTDGGRVELPEGGSVTMDINGETYIFGVVSISSETLGVIRINDTMKAVEEGSYFEYEGLPFFIDDVNASGKTIAFDVGAILLTDRCIEGDDNEYAVGGVNEYSCEAGVPIQSEAGCVYGCGGGRCLGVPDRCIDTDGGDFPEVWGQAYANGSTVKQTEERLVWTGGRNMTYLEWECTEGGELQAVLYECALAYRDRCEPGTVSDREVVPVGTCLDGDGGRNISEGSWAIGVDGIYFDECTYGGYQGQSKKGLMEAVCLSNGSAAYEDVECGGECVAEDYSHKYGIRGYCLTAEEARCVDSDGGINENVTGYVTDNGERYDDQCGYGGYVVEYYCEDGAYNTEYLQCSNGCEDGACIVPREPVCVDSDGGDEITSKGRITNNVTGGGRITLYEGEGENFFVGTEKHEVRLDQLGNLSSMTAGVSVDGYYEVVSKGREYTLSDVDLIVTKIVEANDSNGLSTGFIQLSIGGIVLEDGCVGALEDGRKKWVREYYCDGGRIEGKDVECGFGCEAGACVKNNEVPEIEYFTYWPGNITVGMPVTFSYKACDPDGEIVVMSGQVCDVNGLCSGYLGGETFDKGSRCSEGTFTHTFSERGRAEASIVFTDDAMEMSKRKSEFWVSEAREVKPVCRDSDGRDAGSRGVVTVLNGTGRRTFWDSCLSDFSVDEWYCDGADVKEVEYSCPDGCYFGRCYGDVGITGACTDDDGGVNVTVVGVVTVVAYDENVTFPDGCVNASTVAEYYCGDGGVEKVLEFCPDGCTEGVCRQACVCAPDDSSPVCGENGRTYDNACEAKCSGVNSTKSGACSEELFCEDSDGGVVVEVAGEVEYSAQGVDGAMKDTCLDGGRVKEYYCNGTASGSKEVACEYGCLEGRCSEKRFEATCEVSGYSCRDDRCPVGSLSVDFSCADEGVCCKPDKAVDYCGDGTCQEERWFLAEDTTRSVVFRGRVHRLVLNGIDNSSSVSLSVDGIRTSITKGEVSVVNGLPILVRGITGKDGKEVSADDVTGHFLTGWVVRDLAPAFTFMEARTGFVELSIGEEEEVCKMDCRTEELRPSFAFLAPDDGSKVESPVTISYQIMVPARLEPTWSVEMEPTLDQVSAERCTESLGVCPGGLCGMKVLICSQTYAGEARSVTATGVVKTDDGREAKGTVEFQMDGTEGTYRVDIAPKSREDLLGVDQVYRVAVSPRTDGRIGRNLTLSVVVVHESGKEWEIFSGRIDAFLRDGGSFGNVFSFTPSLVGTYRIVGRVLEEGEVTSEGTGRLLVFESRSHSKIRMDLRPEVVREGGNSTISVFVTGVGVDAGRVEAEYSPVFRNGGEGRARSVGLTRKGCSTVAQKEDELAVVRDRWACRYAGSITGLSAGRYSVRAMYSSADGSVTLQGKGQLVVKVGYVAEPEMEQPCKSVCGDEGFVSGRCQRSCGDGQIESESGVCRAGDESAQNRCCCLSLTPPELPEDTVSLSLSEGWNLVSFPHRLIKESTCDQAQPLYHIGGRSVRTLSAVPSELLKEIKNEGNLYRAAFRYSFWIYTPDVCRITFFDRPQEEIGTVRDLERGWNFQSVKSRSIGKSIEDMAGGCDVKRAYVWDRDGQSWKERDIADEFTEGDIYSGYVLKVSSACVFGVDGNG